MSSRGSSWFSDSLEKRLVRGRVLRLRDLLRAKKSDLIGMPRPCPYIGIDADRPFLPADVGDWRAKSSALLRLFDGAQSASKTTRARETYPLRQYCQG